jgi:flagellar biogenesis protein FliO
MKILYLIFTIQYALFAAPASTSSAPQKKEPQVKKESSIPDRIEDTEDEDPEREHPSFDDDQFQKNFMRTIVAVLIIIILALIALWAIKKMSRGRRFSMNHKRSIKILESRAVSGQTIIYHLEIAGKQIVVAESKCSVKTLTELDWPMGDKDPINKL